MDGSTYILRFNVKTGRRSYPVWLRINGEAYSWTRDRDKAEPFKSPEAAFAFVGLGRRDRRIEIEEVRSDS